MPKNRHCWTDDQTDALTRLYPDMRTDEVAKHLNVSVKQAYYKAHLLGLKKSKAFLEGPDSTRIRKGGNIGSRTQFQKGHATWNKGMKGLNIGGKETRFKPGHRQGRAEKLYQPVGSERISKDGYLQRKINDDMPFHKRWRAVHLMMWEETNGPIPRGYAVVFKDGNKQNIALENMELISRAELMRRNSYHQYGPEIAKLVQLRGAVTRQINKKGNKT